MREGGELRPASWEQALRGRRGARREKAGARRALAGGETTNEEAFLLQRLLREGLGSGDLDSRARRRGAARAWRARWPRPALQATVPDLEFAHAVLVARLRPARRRADPRPADPQGRAPPRRAARGRDEPRPSALDPNAERTVRFAPGAGEALLVALDAALAGDDGTSARGAAAAGADAADRARAGEPAAAARARTS